jgi:hypothetical protein
LGAHGQANAIVRTDVVADALLADSRTGRPDEDSPFAHATASCAALNARMQQGKTCHLARALSLHASSGSLELVAATTMSGHAPWDRERLVFVDAAAPRAPRHWQLLPGTLLIPGRFVHPFRAQEGPGKTRRDAGRRAKAGPLPTIRAPISNGSCGLDRAAACPLLADPRHLTPPLFSARTRHQSERGRGDELLPADA